MSKPSKFTTQGNGALFDRFRYFAKSEDGNLFVVAVPIIIIMAIWGGIAIDLMRFESRRAMLQDITDQATLAAANLDQSQDPAAVVKDYSVKTSHIFTAPRLAQTCFNNDVDDETKRLC